ncbi:MAG: signal peptidase I [Bacteroidia bacterium]|nr:signal peptidase I [Bacteroidia bacterium]
MFFKNAGKKSDRKKSLKDWLNAVLIALLILLFFRIFIGQSVTIPSSRMEKSVMTGDHLFINKLKYGTRLPITLLTIPFTDNTIPFTEAPSYLGWIQLPYFRLPGFSKIKRNDLVAFNYPYENDVPVDFKTVYVKRCIALPGDSLIIYNKNIFINQIQLQTDSENVQYRYRVVVKKGKSPGKDFWGKYEISEGGFITDYVYDYNITLKNAARIEKDSMITDVRLLRQNPGQSSKIYFPNDAFFNWNPDYFGPVKIPRAKDTLSLSIKNLPVYRRIIEVYEKNKMEVSDEKILINDAETYSYVVKQNYYFVLDDNRDDAKDSRYWGFLPEDHIIGKASFVWFSFDKNKSGFGNIRWSRFFKSL